VVEERLATATRALERMSLKRGVPLATGRSIIVAGAAEAARRAAGCGGREPFKTGVFSAQIHAEKPCFAMKTAVSWGFLLTNWKTEGSRKVVIRRLV
jgi:hypothetical protein